MKVLVLTGHDWALVNYRGSLLRAFIAAGHEVAAAAPAENPPIVTALNAMGARFVPVPLVRAGMNPLADFRTTLALREVMRREAPDVVLSFAVKSVIYGSLAARHAGVRRIHALVAGLGSAFNTSGVKGALLKAVTMTLYRRAFRVCDTVFVQNSEIADLFVRRSIATPEKIQVVAGSGVDTVFYPEMPLPEGAPVFLFVGRLLRDKGIREFVAAARRVKARIPAARFVAVGDTDTNPASCSATEVEQWRREAVVEPHGFAQDVRPFLQGCTFLVLPSYHEGVPRSVLEAMSTGRPIITTDTIGCRETIAEPKPDALLHGVKRGKNGYLVPVRTVEPLVEVMRSLASDRVLAETMARESRLLAENRFDVRVVNAMMLKRMKL